MSDGATTDTVDKARFDGLMGSYQRALGMLTPEQRASLKSPHEPAADGTSDDDSAAAQTDLEPIRDEGIDLNFAGEEPEEGSQQIEQPEFEEGVMYAFVGGRMVPQDAPTPLRHNGVSRTFGAKREPTFADLDRMAGKPSRGGDPWANIAAQD
jgi:hypothetical protein